MVPFLVRRVALGLVVLFAVMTMTFFIVRASGDPFEKEKNIPESVREALRKEHGLSGPLWRQYAGYLGDVARGDLRRSIKFKGVSVSEIVIQSLPVSAFIGFLALTLAVFVGVPLGTIAAARRNTGLDYAAMSFAVLGICLPTFVIAPLLVMLFAFALHLLPSGGWGTVSGLILPSVALAFPFTAYISRLTRAGLLEELDKDYVRTARAKGLRERDVVIEHALRNGILPVVTYLGPAAADVLTGSFVIESLFTIPGIGSHFVNSALNQDIFLMMGCTIVFSAVVILFNMLVDISYTVLNPRMRVS